MDPKYLLDTSALYPAILRLREEILAHAERLAVLDLTKYEVGNVLWKEHKRGRVADLESAAALFREVLRHIREIEVEADDLPGVLRVAVERDLSFYDSSYVYEAESRGIKLVSEDEEIVERCQNALRLEEFLADLSPRGGPDPGSETP